jgi:hypothetical protein
MEAGFGRAYRLGVDVPIDWPHFRGDSIEEPGFFHGLAELDLEDLGKRPDGEIEIDPGGMPATIEGGEGAAGDPADGGIYRYGNDIPVLVPPHSRCLPATPAPDALRLAQCALRLYRSFFRTYSDI